jgi:hypothetical protein
VVRAASKVVLVDAFETLAASGFFAVHEIQQRER